MECPETLNHFNFLGLIRTTRSKISSDFIWRKSMSMYCPSSWFIRSTNSILSHVRNNRERIGAAKESNWSDLAQRIVNYIHTGIFIQFATIPQFVS